MGMFSWKTADTKQSIANIHSGHVRAGDTIYLLQPNGESPIKEENYAGYGEFGHVDAYAWLARKNITSEIVCSDDEMRILGITLEFGLKFYVVGDFILMRNDNEFLKKHICEVIVSSYNKVNGVEKKLVIATDYAKKIDEVGGLSLNDLADHEGAIKLSSKKYFNIRYPIKLSYNEDAVYEDLKASKDCEYQGFFY